MPSNPAVFGSFTLETLPTLSRSVDLARPCASTDYFVGSNHIVVSGAVRCPAPVTRFAVLSDIARRAHGSADTAVGSFEPASWASTREVRKRRAKVCAFDGTSALSWVPDDAAVPKSVRGLCYRKGQTFGIEFELAPRHGEIPTEDSAEWRRVANAIADALKHHLPAGKFGGVYAEYLGCERGGKSPAHWNIEYDDTTGWEVTTRVLEGLEGLCEVDAACRALQQVAEENDLCVDVRTGTHIHLGWHGGIAELKQAVGLVRVFEPALGSLVTPSRIAHFAEDRYDLSAPNAYCRPVSAVLDSQTLDAVSTFSDVSRLTTGEDDLRYVTFNLRPLAHQQTVEVRLHHGTLDPATILLWVSLWQQLLWAAENPRRNLDAVSDVRVITPTADLLALVQDYLAPSEQDGQRAFLAKLRRQRSQIVERHWKKRPELAPWVAASRCWAGARPGDAA